MKIAYFSSIQDSGRVGFQKDGIPFSGVMDQYSYKLGNTILGNQNDCAVIEFTLPGSKLQFEKETTIVITGADFSPTINNISVSNNSLIQINAGDILSFDKHHYGNRCYLSIKGGFNSEYILGSRSMYQNITKHSTIVKGDLIPYNQTPQINLNSKIKVLNLFFDDITIEVFKGPEFDLLPEKLRKRLASDIFTISKINNRMAYQLNELLHNELPSIITSPVLPGTVQLTPNGQLIILMRDCQTTGGYPRVLQLSENSINMLAQKATNNPIHFKLTDIT